MSKLRESLIQIIQTKAKSRTFEKVDAILQLFKDIVGREMPNVPLCEKGKNHKMIRFPTDEGYITYCETCLIHKSFIYGFKKSLKQFRQNLSKILSE